MPFELAYVASFVFVCVYVMSSLSNTLPHIRVCACAFACGGVFSSYNASESSCGTRAWRVYQNQLSEKSKLADLQARCRKLGLKEYGSKPQVACEGGEF